MNDPEFRQMMKTFLIILLIVLAFLIPLFFIFHNKIIGKENSILTDIKKNKTVVIYITENNCSKCNDIKKELKRVNYKEISKTNKSYNRMISKLDMKELNISTPALLYVKKGKLYSYIVEIKTTEEVKKFINNYKLSK